MTNQEMYDRVARHLLTQQARAVVPVTPGRLGIDGNVLSSVESCRYRTPSGLKCAIGCLIPDDKYQESMEGAGIGSRPAIAAAIGIRGAEQLMLAAKLQVIHDSWLVESWAARLKMLAEEYRLVPFEAAS
jgi:hypothetical protein